MADHLKPPMPDLKDLAERVEKASGPDRELDCLIQWHVVRDHPFPFSIKLFRFHSEDQITYEGEDENGRFLRGCPTPHFTGDLIAAKGIGHSADLWCVGIMEDGPFARVVPAMPGGTYGDEITVLANTAPLALCSAFIRAASLRALSQWGG